MLLAQLLLCQLSMSLPYPHIDPVLVAIGPFAIRWYALAYIAGIMLGWRHALQLVKRINSPVTARNLDDFLLWATLGIILGGRIGYVLFYQWDYFSTHPGDILKVWQGGMSFHGGLLGMALAIWRFARANRLPLLHFADIVAASVPIGLFFGRIANFINGELFGRPTTVPWGMVFPTGGNVPRHPSQLYEAALEGVLLFLILNLITRRMDIRTRPGLLTGVFLIGYAAARFAVEFFRLPDQNLGFIWGGWLTQGQLLTVPMLVAGLVFAVRRPPLNVR